MKKMLLRRWQRRSSIRTLLGKLKVMIVFQRYLIHSSVVLISWLSLKKWWMPWREKIDEDGILFMTMLPSISPPISKRPSTGVASTKYCFLAIHHSLIPLRNSFQRYCFILLAPTFAPNSNMLTTRWKRNSKMNIVAMILWSRTSQIGCQRRCLTARHPTTVQWLGASFNQLLPCLPRVAKYCPIWWCVFW